MDELPVITCAGSHAFFAAVQPLIVQHLPREQFEWRRSYGRGSRLVRLAAHFIPFDGCQLLQQVSSAASSNLVGMPFLHIFWLDCDMDTYRMRARDELLSWHSQLRTLNVVDWLVVVVVHDESKVKTKILRTSIYDKVKNEFGSKQPDRVIQLTEPLRHDATSEPWVTLLIKVKELMLMSYSRNLSRYEDKMRAERDRRNESSWSFNHYFMLQEELASFYDTLGLYDDALVQYDELDALFTQFIVSHVSATSTQPTPWLMRYVEPSKRWDSGLPLDRVAGARRRCTICDDSATLFDLRGYLLSQQCSLLLRLGRPWEAARRALAAVASCAQEQVALGVRAAAGSTSCWSLLTCAGALALCEQYKLSATLSEEYYTSTAGLWKTVQSCLYDLGKLCGLMPSSKPTSEQLHLVVELIAGMTDMAESHDDLAGGRREMRPQQRLRSALSSQQAFEDYYLEVTELAMGTFKHIGHLRTARLLGNQLASFYMQRGEAQKAESFLVAALASYEQERWCHLADAARLRLAECVLAAGRCGCVLKMADAFLAVAASASLNNGVRADHLQQFIDLDRVKVEPSEQALEKLTCRSAFHVAGVCSTDLQHVVGRSTTLRVTVLSSLPFAVTCRAALSMKVTQALDTPASAIDLPAQHQTAPPGEGIATAARPRLCVVRAMSELGEPCYSIVCSNARTLLARRDSRPAGGAVAARRQPSSDSLEEAAPLGAPVVVPSAGATMISNSVTTLPLSSAHDTALGCGSSDRILPDNNCFALEWSLTSDDVVLAPGANVVDVTGIVPCVATFRPGELCLQWRRLAVGLDCSNAPCPTVVTGNLPPQPCLIITSMQGRKSLLFGVNNACIVRLLFRHATTVLPPVCSSGPPPVTKVLPPVCSSEPPPVTKVLPPVCSSGPPPKTKGLQPGHSAPTCCTATVLPPGSSETALAATVLPPGSSEAALVATVLPPGLSSEVSPKDAVTPSELSQCVHSVEYSCNLASDSDVRIVGDRSWHCNFKSCSSIVSGYLSGNSQDSGHLQLFATTAAEMEVGFACDPPDFGLENAVGVYHISASCCCNVSTCAECTAGIKAEAVLCFEKPFAMSHRLYTAASRKFVQVSIETIKGCDISFNLSRPDLSFVCKDASNGILSPVGQKDVGAVKVLPPAGRVCYLWRLDGDSGCLLHRATPLSLKFSVNFHVSGDTCEEQLGFYTFSVSCRQTLFEVSKQLSPLSDYYLMTKECKMDVTIRRAHRHDDGGHLSGPRTATSHPCCYDDGDTNGQPFVTSVCYEIKSTEDWAISGDKTGELALRCGQTELSVLLVPLRSGYLHLPPVVLHSAQANVDKKSEIVHEDTSAVNDNSLAQRSGSSAGRGGSLAGKGGSLAGRAGSSAQCDSICVEWDGTSADRGDTWSDTDVISCTSGSVALMLRVDTTEPGERVASGQSEGGGVIIGDRLQLDKCEVYDRSAATVIRVLQANEYT